uniref:Uncharacterized protein n=1 Tax=Arundo donax TaxID=35708 RepID=A0A0A9D5Y1_ARUDO
MFVPPLIHPLHCDSISQKPLPGFCGKYWLYIFQWLGGYR